MSMTRVPPLPFARTGAAPLALVAEGAHLMNSLMPSPRMRVLFTPAAHGTEQPSLVGRGVLGPKFTIQCKHIAHDALGIRPVCEFTQRQIARGLLPTDPSVVAVSGLLSDI